jgi:hypothetical protein
VATFAFIHVGGGSAWDWHLVAPELGERGHEPVAVELPSEDESAGWWNYTDAVTGAGGDRRDVVVVGHSLGGFTAPRRLRTHARRPPRPGRGHHPGSRGAPRRLVRYLLCRDDRMFPAAWARRHVRERLGPEPDEIDGGHYITLSRPRELAERLVDYAT